MMQPAADMPAQTPAAPAAQGKIRLNKRSNIQQEQTFAAAPRADAPEMEKDEKDFKEKDGRVAELEELIATYEAILPETRDAYRAQTLDTIANFKRQRDTLITPLQMAYAAIEKAKREAQAELDAQKQETASAEVDRMQFETGSAPWQEADLRRVRSLNAERTIRIKLSTLEEAARQKEPEKALYLYHQVVRPAKAS